MDGVMPLIQFILYRMLDISPAKILSEIFGDQRVNSTINDDSYKD